MATLGHILHKLNKPDLSSIEFVLIAEKMRWGIIWSLFFCVPSFLVRYDSLGKKKKAKQESFHMIDRKTPKEVLEVTTSVKIVVELNQLLQYLIKTPTTSR